MGPQATVCLHAVTCKNGEGHIIALASRVAQRNNDHTHHNDTELIGMPTASHDHDPSLSALSGDAHSLRGATASDDLVALVCAYKGVVPRTAVRGFAEDLLEAWTRYGVLIEAGG